MPLLTYQFEKSGNSRDDGFNASPSTTFLADTRQSIAREALQNILDAKTINNLKPVIAKFKVISSKARELPEPDQLIEVFKACGDYYPQLNVKNFYKIAIEKIRLNKIIKILKISDFNTQGLSGDPKSPDFRESNFYCFAKSEGSTNKGDMSGGSWGLGKSAFYNLSGFKTIFYSSIYEDDKYVFGGMLDLNTHILRGVKEQGNGAFGKKDQEEVREKSLIPKLFKRDTIKNGTDIFIVDFDDSGSWEKQITVKILYNFWKAIYDGLLVVEIGDRIKVEKSNLDNIFKEFFDPYKPDHINNPNPYSYYSSYVETTETPYTEKVPVLGSLKMYYSFQNHFQNRIQFIRNNGMVIKTDRIDFAKKYSGVFVCENDEGNRILRKMENPAHDKWSKNYLKPGEDERILNSAFKAEIEIKNFIKNFLEKIGKTIVTEEADIPKLDEMLGIENPDEFAGFNTTITNSGFGDISDEETALKVPGKIYEINKDKVIKEISIPVSTIGSKGDIDIIIHKNGKRHRHKKGGGTENGNIEILSSADYLSFATSGINGAMMHEIHLHLGYQKKLNLIVGLGTEQGVLYEHTALQKVTDENGKQFRIDGNKIVDIITDTKGDVVLKVYFRSHDRYSIGLKAQYEEIK